MNPIQLQDLQTLVGTLADLINVGWSLTHGGSIFNALVLSGDFSKLSSMKSSDVLAAFQSLDPADRKALEAQLVAKVQLPQAAQLNVANGVSVFEECVQLGYSIYANVLDAIQIEKDIKSKF